MAERILCPQFFGDEYEEKPIMAKFAEKIKSNSVTYISPECPERLLKHGFYTTLNYLVDNWFLPQKIDIVDDLRTAAGFISRSLENAQTLATNFKNQ